MTIDTERWDNINWTREFLKRLATPGESIVPVVVRKEALRLLKHYPERWWVDEMRKKAKSDAG